MSTKTKVVAHTPGPWQLWGNDGSIYAGAETVSRQAITGKNLKRIAILDPDDIDDDDEVIANGLVIAAAYDLLAAAELTVLHFKRNQASGNFQGDDEHEAWTALDKAISRARRQS